MRNWIIFTYPTRIQSEHHESQSQPTPSAHRESQSAVEREMLSQETNPAKQSGDRETHRSVQPSVSAVQLSLRTAIKPASSPDNLLFCTEEGEDVRGTGVFALPHKQNGSIDWRSIHQIGRRHQHRETWMQDLGMGRAPAERTDLQPDVPVNEPSPGVEATPEIYREHEEGTGAISTGPGHDMTPEDFQKAILAMQPGSSSPNDPPTSSQPRLPQRIISQDG